MQKAQKLFEESEDHIKEIKSSGGESTAEQIVDIMQKLTSTDPESTSDGNFTEVLKGVQSQLQNLSNDYLEKAFPEIFA